MGDLHSNSDFYYQDESGEYKKLSEITSISVELSEEDAARLWVLVEGLEIVPNDWHKG